MDVIAVYPGRFHPFHKGHAASFKQLASKFGLDNTYLAISAKQEQPKSPFSAQDRAKMAVALGIPSDHIIAVSNPYSNVEYVNKFESEGYDPTKTALVFGVSKKDMEGDPALGIPPDPRFSFKPKKDGSAAYLQPWTGKQPIAPMSKHAYVMSTDVAEFPIAGKTMRDASAIRSAYAGADNNTKMKILTDLYGNAADKMKQVFDNNLQITESIKALVNKIKPLISEATVSQKEKFVKLLSEAKKKMNESQQQVLGWSDVNIIKDLGDGYLLSMDVDDDYDVRKVGYDVVKRVPSQDNKFIYVGHCQVSPYGRDDEVKLPREIQRLIAQDKSTHNGESDLDESDDKVLQDPEGRATLAYAQQHYPGEPSKQAAFMKFVQRSLKHSKEDDERQDKEIEDLRKQVKKIDARIPSSTTIHESDDYLDEK